MPPRLPRSHRGPRLALPDVHVQPDGGAQRRVPGAGVSHRDKRGWGGVPCAVCDHSLLPPSACSAPQLHVGVVIAGVFMACFSIGTLSLVACSNPGIVPKQTPDEMEGQRQRMEEAGMEGTFTVCRESVPSLHATATRVSTCHHRAAPQSTAT